MARCAVRTGCVARLPPAPHDARVSTTPTTRPVLRSAVTALPPYVPGARSTSALTAALASNESHFAPLPSVVEVVRSSTDLLHRYPDAAGTDLRLALGEHLGVSPEQVAVGPGSVGVLQQVVTAVCDAGDEVVFAWRSFEAYPVLTGLAGARAVPVPLRADEGHDLEAMAAAITGRTRLVLLCTPNNPTGVALTAAELDGFLDRVPDDVLVVVDEAYVEYAGGQHPDALDQVRRRPNVCVLRTFSKAYGLAGLRVGYAVAHPELADGLRRTALPFGVTTLAQRAAVASLAAGAEMRERVAAVTAERTRVEAAVRAAGWTVPDGAANFLWLRTEAALHERLVRDLAAADILVRAFTGDPGGRGGVRVTLADRATNDRVLTALGRR